MDLVKHRNQDNRHLSTKHLTGLGLPKALLVFIDKMHYLEYITESPKELLFIHRCSGSTPEILNQYTRDATQAYARTSVLCENLKKGAV